MTIWQAIKISTEGGACREKEIQSLVIQTSGMCANDRIEMVYQFIATSAGDADENR